MRQVLQAILVCVVAAAVPLANAQERGFVGPLALPGNGQQPSIAHETLVAPASRPDEGAADLGSGSDAANRSSTLAIESRPLGVPDDAMASGEPGGARPGPSSFRQNAESEPAAGALPIEVGPGWWRTAGALALVISVILCIAAVVRKLAGRSGGLMPSFGAGGRSPAGLLEVLGRYPVGRGQTLVLLKLDRRVLLLCQSAGAKGVGMRTLCEVTDPDEVAALLMHAADAEGRSLSARFRDMVSGFDAAHTDAAVTMQPVEVRAAVGSPSPLAGQRNPRQPDPVNQLASRLDGLRQRGVEVTA